ncbi:beta-glucan synthesis-associated protein SKN1 [Coprinopsis sp. MPI-PUGE-AT-0042]|nr:beta-glucan synthesis-associated protein SKN1 [Coprinopsis sp. MPI-PUGE-AT-0042]
MSRHIQSTVSSAQSLLPHHNVDRRTSSNSAVGNGNGMLSTRPSTIGSEFYKHSSMIYEKYSLPASPQQWGTPLSVDIPEPDDDLHNPDSKNAKRSGVSWRGASNLGCLVVLILAILMLFAGYPVVSYVLRRVPTTQGGFNLGGINATGQVPDFAGNRGLIDVDTPQDVYTKSGYHDGKEYVLVFSDEFEQEGRTFYPGDDPYWEAVDFHYWGTNDLEWYDPSQITTSAGALQIKLDRVSNPDDNHNLTYKSGMLQSWNKFCFTGGILEASIRLPGASNVQGLWPALWTLGNLGRAGYGATLEGLWPYSYDSCDVGTLKNQTLPGQMLPEAAVTNGDPYNGDVLSFLPGQRLSACTCDGESHPGPKRSNGQYVGRSAPEIDVIEATVHAGIGQSSMSAQWAPYNAEYKIANSSGEVEFHDPNTVYNEYVGGVWQQTTSGLSLNNQEAYEASGGLFATYAFEYKPGFDDGYITWVNDAKKTWTLYASALGPDTATEIGQRLIPVEPMYIITNLGFSENFGTIEYEKISFPATMSVDWIRVYQPADERKIGCDPVEYPTRAYIEAYKELYANPNLTTWEGAGQPWPKNSFAGDC